MTGPPIQRHFAPTRGTILTHQRLLIIEDEFLIALDIQRVLEATGTIQTVIVRDFTEAASLEGGFGDFNLAIVNPPHGRDFDTAWRLMAARVVLVVCSAGPVDLDGTPLAGAPVISKPFADEHLLAAYEKARALRPA